MLAIQSPIDSATEVLRRQMLRPQRHRLLHGYPLAAAMKPRRDGAAEDVRFDPRAGRALLVGVLPHPFCNPAVAGCGFCTFPHAKYAASRAREVIAAVRGEIAARVRRQPALLGRPVTALYFGGGTANLSPADSFCDLCRALAMTFDLRAAEVTLEGVPAYFLHREPLLMDVLREELPARHFRVSMGVQTFDEQRLGQMGRLAFGTEPTFRAVVEQAHARGFTASADLLFDLPHQTAEEMADDVRKAVALGLDHLGLYHLVMFRGLGTAWSRDESLLAGLPSNEEGVENWLGLRCLLLESGFRQTTLTNFERDEFLGHARRFLYEECGFRPDRFEMLGFGPSAISFAADAPFRAGLKVLNPDAAPDYVASASTGPAWDRSFEYGPLDLRIFYLTRRLGGLEIDRGDYRNLFGTDPLVDFAREFTSAFEMGLLEEFEGVIRPTPRGMFYADAIASTWARRRVRSPGGNDNGRGHM